MPNAISPKQEAEVGPTLLLLPATWCLYHQELGRVPVPDLPEPCQSMRIIHKLVTLAESKGTASFGTWVHSTRHKPGTSAVFYCLKNWWHEGIPLHYGQFSLTPDLSRNFNQAPNSCRVECAARQLSKNITDFLAALQHPRHPCCLQSPFNSL